MSSPPPLPDRREFWRWVWSAVRPVAGWVLAAAGAVALFLAWYGVSGVALPAQQLPYLVSGGLSGLALLVLAAAFLATEDVRRQLDQLHEVREQVASLYLLLTEPDTALDDEAVVAVAGGSSYHRASCRLVAGKASARPLRAGEVAERHLAPCRVCDPPPLRTA